MESFSFWFSRITKAIKRIKSIFGTVLSKQRLQSHQFSIFWKWAEKKSSFSIIKIPWRVSVFFQSHKLSYNNNQNQNIVIVIPFTNICATVVLTELHPHNNYVSVINTSTTFLTQPLEHQISYEQSVFTPFKDQSLMITNYFSMFQNYNQNYKLIIIFTNLFHSWKVKHNPPF